MPRACLQSVVDALKIAADFIFGSYFPFLGDFGKGSIRRTGHRHCSDRGFCCERSRDHIRFGGGGYGRANCRRRLCGRVRTSGLVDTLKKPFETFLSYINFWWELAISPINIFSGSVDQGDIRRRRMTIQESRSGITRTV